MVVVAESRPGSDPLVDQAMKDYEKDVRIWGQLRANAKKEKKHGRLAEQP